MPGKPDRLDLWIDEKMRVIDLPASKFQVPDAGIYDEPVRYYKANLQWARFIEGIVMWLAENTAWEGIEQDGSLAEQSILTFVEGVEPTMALTQEQMEEATCKGVLCALEIAGQRMNLASITENIVGDITIDKDSGTIEVVEKEATISLPDGITSEQKLSGGASEIQSGYNAYIAKMETWYQAYGQEPTPDLATWKLFMESKWTLDTTETQGAIDAYKAYRDTLAPAPAPFSGLNEYLYCNGFSVNKVGSFVIDEVASNQTLYLSLIKPIEQEQFNDWLADGKGKPNDNYTGYACVPYPDIEIIYTADNFINKQQVSFDILTPQYYRVDDRRSIKVTITGKFTDSLDNGNTVDAYYRTASGNPNPAQEFWTKFQFWDNNFNATQLIRPDQLVYESTGAYSFIFTLNDRGAGVSDYWNQIQILHNTTNADSWRANATGQMTIKFQDLGKA